MASTGTAPARETQPSDNTANEQNPVTKALSWGQRFVQKLHKIFEHNEELGVTRS